MKRFLNSVILALAFVIISLFFVSCGNSESTGSLKLNETAINLAVGNNAQLTATYDERSEYTLTYESSNETVVSVDDTGKMIARKKGSATITATYGEQTATCAVVVDVPSLSYAFSEREIMLNKRQTKDLKPSVSFCGEIYNDATVSYSLSDNSVGEIINGIFTPKALGQTTVTVTAVWRGNEGLDQLTETFDITVERVLDITVNGEEMEAITLYTTESFAGNTYATDMQFLPAVTLDGQRLSLVAALENGDGVVSYTNNLLTAEGEGEARIVLTYTVDGEIEKTYIPVTVSRPIVEMEEPIDFSILDGTLPLESVFGLEYVLTEAIDTTGKEYSVNGKKISGFAYDNAKAYEVELTAYTAEAGCKLTLNVYAKVITTKEDLFSLYPTNARPLVEGYYILANDIDATGLDYADLKDMYAFTRATVSGVDTTTEGFEGTFDGQGYTISNYTPDRYGLVSKMLPNATIYNVAFENVNFTKPASVLAGGTIHASHVVVYVTDVYISVDPNSTVAPSGVIAYVGSLRFTLTNVVVVNPFEASASDSSSTTWENGSLFARDKHIANARRHWLNVYVISKMALTDCKTSASASYGASYYVAYASNEGVTEDASVGKYVYENTYRYDTQAEMAAANNDYTGFTETGNWYVENGMICFGTK